MWVCEPEGSIAETIFKYGEKLGFIATNCSLWADRANCEGGEHCLACVLQKGVSNTATLVVTCAMCV
jgi:hypothetical protein